MSNIIVLCGLGIVLGFGLAALYRTLRRMLVMARLVQTGILTDARVIEIKERRTFTIEVNDRQSTRREWREIIFFQARNGRYVRTALPAVNRPERVVPVGRTQRIFYDPQAPRMAVHERARQPDTAARMRAGAQLTLVFAAGTALGIGLFHSALLGFLTTVFLVIIVLRRSVLDAGARDFLQNRGWMLPRDPKLDDSHAEPLDYLFDTELYPPEDDVLRRSLAMVGYLDAHSVIRPGVPGAPLSVDHPTPVASGRAEDVSNDDAPMRERPFAEDDALEGDSFDAREKAQYGTHSVPQKTDEDEENEDDARGTRRAEPVTPPPATREAFENYLAELEISTLVPWLMKQAAGLHQRELFAVNGERSAADAHPTLPDWVVYGDRVEVDDTAVWLRFGDVLSIRLDIIDRRGSYHGLRVETELGGQPLADALRDALEAARDEYFPQAKERFAILLSLDFDEDALDALDE